MKKLIQKWWMILAAAIFSFSLFGCGDISTGNEELDQAIVNVVVDGVNSYLENTVNNSDSEDASSSTIDSQESLTPEATITSKPAVTEAPTPTEKAELTETPQPTAAKAPTEKPEPTATQKPTATPKPTNTPKPTATTKPTATPKPTNTPTPVPTEAPKLAIEEDGWYYSKEEVALYIHTYGKLPENFITKSEAEKLGWTGGTVENYKEGAAIGGDKFGNREGLLPKKSGRQYYECDIDTKGKGSRGTRRIVFSNDGLIYYTHDHYETFTLLYGKE